MRSPYPDSSVEIPKTTSRREGGLQVLGKWSDRSVSGRPLLTVITVVRNAAEDLARTVQSVLRQTYDGIEYIIVDGGSSDGTLDIIRKYEHRIAHWISEPDRGLYDAMNKGIDLATGEWALFMNAGDTFYDRETVRQVMNGPIGDADMLYGHCRMIYSPERSLVWKTRPPEEIWKGMICRHQSVFTRLAVLKKLHFDLGYRIGADFAFIFLLSRNGYRLKRIDVIVASVTAGGMSDVNLIEGIRENWRTVAGREGSLKVDLYYRWRITWTHIKAAVRRFLPRRIDYLMRAIKHR